MIRNLESLSFHKRLKLIIISLFLVISFQPAEAQALKKYSSTLSMGGPCKIINSGGRRFMVQQSTGQASVIESFRAGGYTLRQGFIQPCMYVKPGKILKEKTGTVSPNPFKESISVNFPDTISEKIYVSICDMYGKILFSYEFPPAQTVNISLYSLSPGMYIIRINSGVKCFNSKIIKE